MQRPGSLVRAPGHIFFLDNFLGSRMVLEKAQYAISLRMRMEAR